MRELVGPTARLGCDEVPHALGRALGGLELRSASAVMGAAKLIKTVDELACIREAQRITEAAMLHVEPMLRTPGTTQTDLTARFVRHAVELGAEHIGIDPIWQVMAPTKAEGPWTVQGGVAFPTPSAPVPLAEGDVIWVDTGIHVGGYASDFGRTWIVGTRPHPHRPPAGPVRAVDGDLPGRGRRLRTRRLRRGRGEGGHRRGGGAGTGGTADRGSSTSTWPTRSGPTAPRCR